MLHTLFTGARSYERIDFQTLLSTHIADDYITQRRPLEEQLAAAGRILEGADAVLIGAGAGLSAAAGLTYGGARFQRLFADFIQKYGPQAMPDMYAAGFYPFPSQEARWGYWSHHAYVNRIQPEGLPLYRALLGLVEGKPHFVLTTNVDHQFEKAGFAPERIFATQGDYGEIQCARGCHDQIYDAVERFRQMEQARRDCCVPSYLVPKCPVCGGEMTMHLRCDGSFVEDENWHQAAARYRDFLRDNRRKRVALLELGVGFHTPVIIRLPFEDFARERRNWSLIRVNQQEAFVPASLGSRGVGISGDLAQVIGALEQQAHAGHPAAEPPMKEVI